MQCNIFCTTPWVDTGLTSHQTIWKKGCISGLSLSVLKKQPTPVRIEPAIKQEPRNTYDIQLSTVYGSIWKTSRDVVVLKTKESHFTAWRPRRQWRANPKREAEPPPPGIIYLFIKPNIKSSTLIRFDNNRGLNHLFSNWKSLIQKSLFTFSKMSTLLNRWHSFIHSLKERKNGINNAMDYNNRNPEKSYLVPVNNEFAI